MESNRRTKTFVLLSGVKMTVRELWGTSQKILTWGKYQKQNRNIDMMLLEATVSIGNNTNVKEEDIKALLGHDRKFALVKLRQFTLDYQEDFEFTYEWEIGGEKGSRKEKQFYSVVFNEEDFKNKAFKWVRDRMEEIQKEKEAKLQVIEGERDIYSVIEEPNDKDQEEEYEFPVMYESYEQMLKEQFEYETVLPRCKKTIRMKLLDAEGEKKASKFTPEEFSSHMPIALRHPREVTMDNERERLFNLSLDSISMQDIEHLRYTFYEREATVDTMLAIENQLNKNRVKRVDLIGVPAFFFPSMGKL